MHPYRRDADGLLLNLRVTPNASAERIEGTELRDDGTAVLRVRVTAAPDKGKANAALIALLAKTLDVPRSTIILVAGGAARTKTVRITGHADRLAEALAALI